MEKDKSNERREGGEHKWERTYKVNPGSIWNNALIHILLSIIQLPLYLPLPPFYLFLSCRVKGMLMVNVLAVAAGLLMGLCRVWKPHFMVIAGRAVMGFYCGTDKHTLRPLILSTIKLPE